MRRRTMNISGKNEAENLQQEYLILRNIVFYLVNIATLSKTKSIQNDAKEQRIPLQNSRPVEREFFF